jgi:transcriptional regulator with XRE-family HTH domain
LGGGFFGFAKIHGHALDNPLEAHKITPLMAFNLFADMPYMAYNLQPMEPALRTLAERLEERRKQLGLTRLAVARRAGMGLRTVQRILSEGATPELSTLSAIARALGASIDVKLKAADVERVKEQQAERKARHLVNLTQGSSALESQAIGQRQLARLKKQTVRQLLTGSPRKLWAD